MAIELHPLEQFTIERMVPLHVGRLDLSYTNSALLMTIAVVLITALIVLGTRRAALVPGRLQSVAEMSYEFVADMVETNVGHEGMPYFPFVFTLFMFILFGNLLGLIPYSFTFTSHIIVTFALAAVVFIGVTIIGFVRHGLHFLPPVRAAGRAEGAAAAAGADRAPVLLHPAVHAVDPAFRQHAGRPHDAGDLRRVRRERRRSSAILPLGVDVLLSSSNCWSRCCRPMSSRS